MLTPKAYGIAYRSLQTRFNSATKFIKELNLESDAEAAILETLSAQYVAKVKGLQLPYLIVVLLCLCVIVGAVTCR